MPSANSGASSNQRSAKVRRTGAIVAPGAPPQVVPAIRAFADRRDAGLRLAGLLRHRALDRAVVVAIPRGGVPVAAAVAAALGAPLDVVVVRKVGAPRNPELAIGAIAEGGVRVLAERTKGEPGLSAARIVKALAKAEAELRERSIEVRGELAPLELDGRTVIVVDDGLATGHTALAAIQAVRRRGARRVILAVPVAALRSVRALAAEADEIVCVEQPEHLWAVGYWYEDFRAVDAAQVEELLDRSTGA